jgi:uncharacterized protein (DUF2384 family)
MNDAPQADIQKTAGKGTKYVVLLEHAEPGGWEVINDGIAAASATAAIKAVIGPTDSAKRYVAVPERSWKPVKVTVETKQTVKLG